MKKKLSTTLLSGSLSALILFSVTTPASADIEDWLRNTFSTRDFVGDWLKVTFGPVMYDGGRGDGLNSPNIHSKGYRKAVETMVKWEKLTPTVTQVCSPDKLLSVIIESNSPEKTVEACFKIKMAVKRISYKEISSKKMEQSTMRKFNKIQK